MDKEPRQYSQRDQANLLVERFLGFDLDRSDLIAGGVRREGVVQAAYREMEKLDEAGRRNFVELLLGNITKDGFRKILILSDVTLLESRRQAALAILSDRVGNDVFLAQPLVPIIMDIKKRACSSYVDAIPEVPEKENQETEEKSPVEVKSHENAYLFDDMAERVGALLDLGKALAPIFVQNESWKRTIKEKWEQIAQANGISKERIEELERSILLAQIQLLWEQGISHRAIANQQGVPLKDFRKTIVYLMRIGRILPRKPYVQRRSRQGMAELDLLVEQLREEHRNIEIIENYHIPKSTVKKSVHRLSLDGRINVRRIRSPIEIEKLDEDVKRLRKRGLTYDQIAEALFVKHEDVKHSLDRSKKRGIDLSVVQD
jgi:hypothetical protein